MTYVVLPSLLDTYRIILFTDNYVIMWKKVSPDGSPAFLAVGANVMSDRDRITVQLNHHGEKRGSTLLIGLANDNDAGHYVCQLGTNEDNKELKHTVLVRYHSQNTGLNLIFELLPFG